MTDFTMAKAGSATPMCVITRAAAAVGQAMGRVASDPAVRFAADAALPLANSGAKLRRGDMLPVALMVVSGRSRMLLTSRLSL